MLNETVPLIIGYGAPKFYQVFSMIYDTTAKHDKEPNLKLK